MVKTSPFNTGSVGLIPHQGTKIPHASWPKNQNINNRSNVVTNSLSTLKMVHIKKKKSLIEKKKKNRPEFRGWGDKRAETTSRMRASGWWGRWTGWTEAKAWVKKEQGLGRPSLSSWVIPSKSASIKNSLHKIEPLALWEVGAWVEV